MVNYEKLPNFFILGAAKSGTTSLFNILANHYQVYGSPVKETGFFSNDDKFVHGLEWYQETFFKNSEKYPVRMEATPVYLTWSEKTAPRIRAAYPNQMLKFALIFRDPISRAYSHYWHRVRLGQENLTFTDAIQAENHRISENLPELFRTGNGKYGYLRASCYASRLKPFLENFTKNQFFFLLQEDLHPENYENTISVLLDFLEINPNEKLELQKANAATKKAEKWFIRFYWKAKKTFLSNLYRKIINPGDRKKIHSLLFPEVQYPKLDEEIARELKTKFKDEVKELEIIINRDLSDWLS